MNLDNICRLCLMKNDRFLNVFSDEGIRLSVKQKLVTLFQFEINDTDSEQTTYYLICLICHEYICKFYDFYENVRNNQLYFSAAVRAATDIQTATAISVEQENTIVSLDETHDCSTTITDVTTQILFTIPLITQTKAQEDEPVTTDGGECLIKFQKFNCLLNTNADIENTIRTNDEVDDPESFFCDDYDQSSSERESAEIPLLIVHKSKNTRKQQLKSDDRKEIDELLPDHLKIRISRNSSDAKIKEFVNLVCDICTASLVYFDTFKQLQDHFQTVHRIKGYVTCCDKKIFRKDRLLNHITNHLNPCAFKCPTCGQNSKSKILLRIHMKQHLPNEERKFHCDKCSQKFVLRSQLTNHQASHFTEDQKKFVCEICGKAFALKFVMIKHKLTHSKEKNFVCEICAKLFSSKSNLQSHMTQHSQETTPRVKCKYCKSWYKNIETLRTHMRRHRDVRQHICPLCQKECSTQSALAAHNRYVHLKIHSFECNICDKQFRRKLELTEHLARHTGEILYKCPFCPKTFTSSSNYFSHRKNRHAKLFSENISSEFQPTPNNSDKNNKKK